MPCDPLLGTTAIQDSNRSITIPLSIYTTSGICANQDDLPPSYDQSQESMHVDEPPTYQAAASAAERGLDNYIDSKQM